MIYNFLKSWGCPHAHVVARRSIEGVHSWLRLLVLPAGPGAELMVKNSPNGVMDLRHELFFLQVQEWVIFNLPWVRLWDVASFQRQVDSRYIFFWERRGTSFYISKIWLKVCMYRSSPRPCRLSKWQYHKSCEHSCSNGRMHSLLLPPMFVQNTLFSIYIVYTHVAVQEKLQSTHELVIHDERVRCRSEVETKNRW